MTLEERIQQLPPEQRARVINLVDELSSRREQERRLAAQQAADGIIALFGTVEYDPQYDYKAARGQRTTWD